MKARLESPTVLEAFKSHRASDNSCSHGATKFT